MALNQGDAGVPAASVNDAELDARLTGMEQRLGEAMEGRMQAMMSQAATAEDMAPKVRQPQPAVALVVFSSAVMSLVRVFSREAAEFRNSPRLT
ncbi:unnamed protein product [Ectocarpus sp. CCAP 1310/34]|nr:unnamed protein product [Ectocarpus sp. CCAP 1310/34]